MKPADPATSRRRGHGLVRQFRFVIAWAQWDVARMNAATPVSPPDACAATPGIGRRRIYDTRTALALSASGITEFATAKVKDSEGFGFVKVWNPIAVE